jgi:hypothetical protein
MKKGFLDRIAENGITGVTLCDLTKYAMWLDSQIRFWSNLYSPETIQNMQMEAKQIRRRLCKHSW